MKKDFRVSVERLENKSYLSVVAVLDSGMDINHKDLIDNLWVNSQEIVNNNIDDDNNGYIDDIYGWNFISNTNNVWDGYGHGTHVAGIIQGTNPSVKLMTLKIIADNGVGSTSELLMAMDYVSSMANRENIVATNNSWTMGSYGSNVVKDKIQTLSDKNVIFVCAAGNNGADLDVSPNYPSSFKLNNIVSVASITPDGTLSGSSNYGANTVSVAARGTLIYSTYPGDRYASLSGTSMAAPFVTGKISTMSGSINERVFQLMGSVVKTQSLAGKVVSGGFVDVDVNFASGQSSKPAPVEPLRASIVRAGLYSVSGVVNKDQLLSIYVNKRFIGYAKIVHDEANQTYRFNLVLGRKYFVKGWNVVSVRDAVSGLRLDYKMIRRR